MDAEKEPLKVLKTPPGPPGFCLGGIPEGVFVLFSHPCPAHKAVHIPITITWACFREERPRQTSSYHRAGPLDEWGWSVLGNTIGMGMEWGNERGQRVARRGHKHTYCHTRVLLRPDTLGAHGL